MIALVLVLLLVLAITQIFNVTSKAIGKGNATGEVVRGLDAARVALQIDFAGTDNIAYLGFGDKSGMLPTNRQPAIIISSTSIPAFVSQRDVDADSDYDPNEPDPVIRRQQIASVDSDNDGADDLDLTPYDLGTRWFRTDSLSFFTGGEFESQTSLQPAGNSFSGETTSREAWVWYGHGRIYDGIGILNDDSAYWLPGAETAEDNPNHFFASQFALLRTPILLKALEAYPGANEFTVLSDGPPRVPVFHLRETWDPSNLLDVDGNVNVEPFSYLGIVAWMDADLDADGTPAPPFVNQLYPTAANPFRARNSRVDVAGLTAIQYRERLRLVQSYTGALGNQFANGPLRFDSAAPYNANPSTWYNRLFARQNDALNPNQNVARFWINPLVLKPLNAGEVSQASSLLLTGATQFIVEYAGDFLTQDAVTGATTANQPDGVIDFTIDRNSVRHIRWYGMPRDVDDVQDDDGGSNSFRLPGPGAAANAVTLPGGAVSNVLLTSIDVRPLADYVNESVAGTTMTVDSGFPFEKRLPGEYSGSPDGVSGRDAIDDYIDAYAAGDITDWSYLVAWGPADFDGDLYPLVGLPGSMPPGHNDPALDNQRLHPSLIRVIITGIDRQAKLENPISQELVFRVPHE